MDNVSSRVKLMGNLQAAVAEAVSGTMEERGRGFASDREAWAELKECIERTKQMHTDIEKVHKEMWSAVKDRNEDAFAARQCPEKLGFPTLCLKSRVRIPRRAFIRYCEGDGGLQN